MSLDLYHQINIQNNPTPKMNKTFRATAATTTNTLEKTPTSDVLQTRSKKEGMSTGVKLGLGALALAGIGAIACFARGRGNTLINNNSNITNCLRDLKKITLTQNIPVQKFETKEEAINFLKNTLKIDKIDNKTSLEALNDTINSIIKISNKHNGQLYMPKELAFVQKKEDLIASISTDIVNSNVGTLNINSSLYNHSELDELLKNWNKYLFTAEGKPLFQFKNGELLNKPSFNNLTIRPDKEFSDLLQKFYNQRTMTLKEKQNLVLSISGIIDKANSVNEAPFNIITKIQKLYPDFLKEQGFNVNLNDFVQKNTKEQTAELNKMLETLIKNKKNVYIDTNIKTIEDSIFHEFGHLQDLGENRELISNTSQFAKRFSTRKHFEDVILKKHPNFELPKILTDSIEGNTAGKVSSYATTGVGEFIAETYAKLIKGIKLDDDVMALYKKYSGPALT